MSEQETLEYYGVEYVKVQLESKNCYDCTGCAFLDDKKKTCNAPNVSTFWGCSTGGYIWRKKARGEG